jgi:hypothetical protein
MDDTEGTVRCLRCGQAFVPETRQAPALCRGCRARPLAVHPTWTQPALLDKLGDESKKETIR